MPIACQHPVRHALLFRSPVSYFLRLPLFLLTAVGIGVFVACGRTDAPQPFESVPQAISTLEKHTLTNEVVLLYQLIGAFGGIKYDVAPGGYQVEVYVYGNPGQVPKPEELEIPSALSHVFGNALFVLHSIDEEDLRRFVADLKDG